MGHPVYSYCMSTYKPFASVYKFSLPEMHKLIWHNFWGYFFYVFFVLPWLITTLPYNIFSELIIYLRFQNLKIPHEYIDTAGKYLIICYAVYGKAL